MTPKSPKTLYMSLGETGPHSIYSVNIVTQMCSAFLKKWWGLGGEEGKTSISSLSFLLIPNIAHWSTFIKDALTLV